MLVWIQGGGLTQDAGRDYDPTKQAAAGVVVATVNYRLGALGFLAHPALAARPAAQQATTDSWTNRPPCAGYKPTSASSVATPATSRSRASPPVVFALTSSITMWPGRADAALAFIRV